MSIRKHLALVFLTSVVVSVLYLVIQVPPRDTNTSGRSDLTQIATLILINTAIFTWPFGLSAFMFGRCPGAVPAGWLAILCLAAFIGWYVFVSRRDAPNGDLGDSLILMTAPLGAFVLIALGALLPLKREARGSA